MSTNAREQKVRRALYRMGYQLHKSRARNVTFHNQCLYMVVDSSTRGVICGSDFDWDLDDIVSFFELDC